MQPAGGVFVMLLGKIKEKKIKEEKLIRLLDFIEKQKVFFLVSGSFHKLVTV